MNRNTYLIILAFLAAVFGGFLWHLNTDEQHIAAGGGVPEGDALVLVKLPGQLSDNAIAGKRLFDANCASCHGENAAGQKDVAPPLIHIIYEPSHHGDESFQLAAVRGVRAHHWRFGDMPPVEGVSRDDMSAIIAYVRELQQANGIN